MLIEREGALGPLHTSPAALSQTSLARFFDSLPPRLRARCFFAPPVIDSNPTRFQHVRKPPRARHSDDRNPRNDAVGRGAHTPPHPGRRTHRGPECVAPGSGGMWACRPTTFGGSLAEIAGLLGRIFNPPLRPSAGWRADVGIGPYDRRNHGGLAGAPRISVASRFKMA